MYSPYTKEQVKKFVGTYGDAIIAAITNQNLFFPAVVGQLTMESKFGTSGLSANYNNYAGIKSTGSDFTTGKVSLDTIEIVNGKEIPMKQFFASYSTFENFMADYVRVLHLQHFVAAGVFTATTPYLQVLAMGKGGYSTRNPQEYLNLCKGRIDACIDLFPMGKIDTKATPPIETIGSALMIGIRSAISSSLGTIKPAA